MSKRFMLERFLGLTEDEIQKNEEMWREEHDDVDAPPVAGSDLRAVGVTPGGMESDIAMGDEMAAMNQPGAEGAAGMTGPGAAPPAAGPGAPGTL
jgi:hypothetical protein